MNLVPGDVVKVLETGEIGMITDRDYDLGGVLYTVFVPTRENPDRDVGMYFDSALQFLDYSPLRKKFGSDF